MLQSPWQDLVKIAIFLCAMSAFHERMGELTWNVGKSTKKILQELSIALIQSLDFRNPGRDGRVKLFAGCEDYTFMQWAWDLEASWPEPACKGELTRTMSLFLKFEMSRCRMASVVFLFKKRFQRKISLGFPWRHGRGLKREPLKSFCKLVQSGSLTWEARTRWHGACQSYFALWNFRSVLWRCQLFLANPTSKMVPTEVIQLHIATRFAVMMNFQQISSLTRQVQEHKDWATFLDWLPQQGAINLFSLLRRCRMLPGDLAKFTKCQWNIPYPLNMCFFFWGDPKCKLHFCGGPGGALKCNLDPWDVLRMDVFFWGGGGGEKMKRETWHMVAYTLQHFTTCFLSCPTFGWGGTLNVTYNLLRLLSWSAAFWRLEGTDSSCSFWNLNLWKICCI